MENRLKLAVFTDLDGTLLDHDTYRWDAAKPALDRLMEHGCAVVFATSKTFSEVHHLQKQMGLTHQPAIVENGSGVIGGTGSEAAETYPELRKILDHLPKPLRQKFKGFGDMSDEEIATLTRLTPESAERAKARGYSEPGLWTGSTDELSAFRTLLAKHGVTAQRGGRFLTLSFGRTKADAMATLASALNTDLTLALGDAPNDIEMLEKADFGIIVHNPSHEPLPPLRGESEGRIIRTTETGPVGWNAAVTGVLNRVFPKKGPIAHG